MPSAKDLYSGGKHFKASDLSGGPLRLKISSIAADKPGSNSERDKLILKFEGQEKDLILNATNAGVLVGRFGDDYSKWVGSEVIIASVPVQYNGQTVQGIRVVG